MWASGSTWTLYRAVMASDDHEAMEMASDDDDAATVNGDGDAERESDDAGRESDDDDAAVIASGMARPTTRPTTAWVNANDVLANASDDAAASVMRCVHASLTAMLLGSRCGVCAANVILNETTTTIATRRRR